MLAIVLSHGAESIAAEFFLRGVGFSIRSPKHPKLQSVIDAAPDLIVVDWEPGEESRNTQLIGEIRSCTATTNIPILVSASEDVGPNVRAVSRLVAWQMGGGMGALFGALKLLGFGDLALKDPRSTPEGGKEQASRVAAFDAVSAIEQICARMPLVIRQLRLRHKDRQTLDVTDEYDLQDLLHSVLHIFFEDIRSEEHAPSYAGGSSRMDFLLKNESCVIETKMTRKGLQAREVGEQLIVDIERYRSHPECQKLFCLVYDPEHRINNPRGLERDLSGLRDGLDVKVIIAPRGT